MCDMSLTHKDTITVFQEKKTKQCVGFVSGFISMVFIIPEMCEHDFFLQNVLSTSIVNPHSYRAFNKA